MTGGPGPAPVDAGRFWKRLREPISTAAVRRRGRPRGRPAAPCGGLLADGHELVEDVPGTGKATLARALAGALGLTFARVQGTPDLLAGDVTGSSAYEAGLFRFVPDPIFANVLLVDEINRATARTQSALLEAMQESEVLIDGETRALPDPFLVWPPRIRSNSRERSPCRRRRATGFPGPGVAGLPTRGCRASDRGSVLRRHPAARAGLRRLGAVGA